MSWVGKLLRGLKEAGPAAAVAIVFFALLAYAAFLQIRYADTASASELKALEKRLSKNEQEDLVNHAVVATKLDALTEEIRGLREDLRALIRDQQREED
jgi:hypothetical protein